MAINPRSLGASQTTPNDRAPIAFTLLPELLARVDEQDHKLSISRAAFIEQALSQASFAENQ